MLLKSERSLNRERSDSNEKTLSMDSLPLPVGSHLPAIILCLRPRRIGTPIRSEPRGSLPTFECGSAGYLPLPWHSVPLGLHPRCPAIARLGECFRCAGHTQPYRSGWRLIGTIVLPPGAGAGFRGCTGAIVSGRRAHLWQLPTP